MAVIPELPSGWEIFLPQVTSIIRLLMFGLAAVGVTTSAIGDSQISMLSSVVLGIAATVWAIVKNLRAQRALRQAAASPAGSQTLPLPL